MDTEKIVENVLAHHGIKGMHWGFRKSPEQKQARAAKKQARQEKRQARRAERAKRFAEGQDRRFEERANSFETKVAVHNLAGDLMMVHGDIDRINNKSEFVQAAQRGVLLKPDHPVTQKYEKEYMDAYITRVKQATRAQGQNWTGTRELTAVRSNDLFGFTVKTKPVPQQAVHADATVQWKVKFVKDAQGLITGLEIQNDEIKQGALFVEQYLEHHGIKGQKWGVRRDKTPSAPTVMQKGKKLKGSGGKNQPAHPEAVKARSIGQQGKASGLHSLSNKDLEAYARRLDLEQRVQRLEENDRSRANKFIRRLLKSNGQQKMDKADSKKVKAGKVALKLASTAA